MIPSVIVGQRSAPSFVSFQPETLDYLSRVAAADGQGLDPTVTAAVDALIAGCKADGNWDAIKACCLLAGPSTLDGALTPLKGAAPTNHNFLDADYDPVEGLTGDGSTKYLDSGRANDDDPQNSQSVWCWVTTPDTSVQTYMGASHTAAGATNFGWGNGVPGGGIYSRCHNSQFDYGAAGDGIGFVGISRAAAGNYAKRFSGGTITVNRASDGTTGSPFYVFARSADDGVTPIQHTTATIAAYGIGQAVDLDALDARLGTYMAAVAAALT